MTHDPFSADESAEGAVAVRPDPADAQSLDRYERVIPSWTDPTVRRATDLIGGPLGRHAQIGRNRWFTPLRVCLAMAIVVLICGWLYKAACIQQMPDGNGGVTLDQGGQRPWITGCYNDVVPLYGSHQLNTQQLPYKTSWEDNGETRYMEYPVVTGYWMWGVSWIAKGYGNLAQAVGLPVPLDVAGYFTIGAILLGLMYLLAVSCTVRMAGRRPWDAAIMCLSPLLVVHAFTNWDLLAIGLMAAAMCTWSLGRRLDPDRPWGGWSPWVTGLLIGVGTAAKLYPVLLLGPLLVLCLRTGMLRRFLVTAIATAATWAAINLPVALAWPQGWGEFYRLNTTRPAEWDSWYSIFTTLTGSKLFDADPGASSPSFLNNLSLLLFALCCVAIAWFALSAARRPRLTQLAFLLVAAFLLTNKVWSPQYSLWLLPLAALAVARWRPVLAWAVAEAVVWPLLMLSFDSDSGKNLSIYPFIGAALIRDALLILLIVMVIRDVLRPGKDPVRMSGDDDPAGGPLDGAADRWTLPSLPSLWSRRPRPVPTGAAEPAPPAAEQEPEPEPAGLRIGS